MKERVRHWGILHLKTEFQIINIYPAMCEWVKKGMQKEYLKSELSTNKKTFNTLSYKWHKT